MKWDGATRRPELDGRARYQRDLLRLLDRFGTLEAGLRWLKETQHPKPEPPAADFWEDE